MSSRPEPDAAGDTRTPTTTERVPPPATQAPLHDIKEPLQSWWRPAWLNRDLALLLGGRALRSLAQGYLTIIVPIYFAQLGYNSVQLGILFTAAAATSAVLAAMIGFLSDRFGRKSSLILISLMMAGGGIVFALSGNFIVLVLAGALGTIGRGGGAGSGGAWGPYYPAEQALLAEHSSNAQRTTVFGMVSFVGVLAGALGSTLAALPALLHQVANLSDIESYHILFWLTGAIGIAMALIVLPVRDQVSARNARREKRPAPAASPATAQKRKVLGLSASSWSLIWRFMVTNTTNGLAIGVLGPFLVYWFYRRYGVDSSALAALFFAINLAATVPYLMVGRLARRLGAVNTIVITRSISVVLLFLMVMMPTFLLAALVYFVRMLANTLAVPVRQSYLMGIIPADERSTAAGLSNLPSQAGASVSPYITGYLMAAVSLDLPLQLAAVLQGINAILYYVFFHKVRPPEEKMRPVKQ